MPDKVKIRVKLLKRRELETLRESWKCMVADGHQKLASKFLKWMLQNVTGMMDIFAHFCNQGHDNFDLIPEFNAHAQAIVMTIEAMIYIDEPERMDRKITDLVRAHIHRKNSPVGWELFQELRDKIHVFIQQERDIHPESRESKLWTKFFTVIVNICKREEGGVQPSTTVSLRCCWCPVRDASDDLE